MAQQFTALFLAVLMMATAAGQRVRGSRAATATRSAAHSTAVVVVEGRGLLRARGRTSRVLEATTVHAPARDAAAADFSPATAQDRIAEDQAAASGLSKPTKYHYYPHNEHIYLLPECAVQQVCNAVYVRLNFTQPLCACASRYREPCSASTNSDDQHTTELVTDTRGKALTLVKTCEPVSEMRECRSPRDWSLLALQNVRTGKSHYLVVCRCPYTSILEGPISHDQPTYASVPGIRVYGMVCVPRRTRRSLYFRRAKPSLPWSAVERFAETIRW